MQSTSADDGTLNGGSPAAANDRQSFGTVPLEASGATTCSALSRPRAPCGRFVDDPSGTNAPQELTRDNRAGVKCSVDTTGSDDGIPVKRVDDDASVTRCNPAQPDEMLGVGRPEGTPLGTRYARTSALGTAGPALTLLDVAMASHPSLRRSSNRKG
jgi:hypothetical protein